MIEIRNLYKRYHNHHGSDWVLKDINLNIPKGVSVGLIGANGAGKSTLLRLIAGMDSPDKGEVVRHCSVSWPVGLAGGFQGSMTGRQNVKFVARALGGSEKEMHRIIRFVEDFAEIGEAFDEPVKTYSSGMRSRLGFGLSFAFSFDVYISDEATAVGDRAFKDKARKLFRDKVGKASLIMVSHSEGILREFCQAGIYIKSGKAFWYDDISEAIAAYHQDSDKHFEKKRHSGSASMQENSLQHGEESLQDLRRQLKEARAIAGGIWRCVTNARAQGWAKEEVAVLIEQHQVAKKYVDQLTVLINGTPEGKVVAFKQELNQAKSSLDAVDYIIGSDIPNKFTRFQLDVLKKAQLMAQKWHAKAESDLEETGY